MSQPGTFTTGIGLKLQKFYTVKYREFYVMMINLIWYGPEGNGVYDLFMKKVFFHFKFNYGLIIPNSAVKILIFIILFLFHLYFFIFHLNFDQEFH